MKKRIIIIFAVLIILIGGIYLINSQFYKSSELIKDEKSPLIVENKIAPIIDSISPKSGPIGTLVTIIGNGFDLSKFKDGRATHLFISGPYRQSADERHDGEVIDSITNNQIKFKIPSKVLIGKHSISISNPIDSNKVDFEVIDNNLK